ncbi:MAG: (Fe-S)-binding protein [Saprospiraceae bacterium]|nr:(Fe-S)-binding protein [Bacteroidia bacterium]NNE15985.1 (Fe-S)-binding protein [Saprospiraceae bacterium]NNL93225.1 (Fe-S)-binding protein [Saprospiraceae bacterium]
MAIQQILFILLLLIVGFFSYKFYSRIFRTIHLGKEETITGNKGERWKNVMLVAFGQKKMFKNFIPAILHLFIYVAFLFTQIELIEIIIDGIFGVHRFFADKISILYPIIINTIEWLSLLAFIATVIFLARRNLLKIPRFRKPEMKGWPTLDANYILIGEILLIIGIFSMNSADGLLQNMDPAHFPDTGHLMISSVIGSAFLADLSQSTLMVIERFGWWLHILVVFSFLLYLPISKHLHIILAFPNVYFNKLEARGKIGNMPEIMNEVKSMMGLIPESEMAVDANAELPDFGVKDVFDLSWKNILDAHTCTECGRCTAVCPANQTGKKLSPRKILMDIRDRATEVELNISSGSQQKESYDDGKSLFDYISDEEIFACTTCNACVEACPVLINPLEPIIELRRYKLLTESAGPSDWLSMFNALENSGSVWQMPDQRFDWAKELNDSE